MDGEVELRRPVMGQAVVALMMAAGLDRSVALAKIDPTRSEAVARDLRRPRDLPRKAPRTRGGIRGACGNRRPRSRDRPSGRLESGTAAGAAPPSREPDGGATGKPRVLREDGRRATIERRGGSVQRTGPARPARGQDDGPGLGRTDRGRCPRRGHGGDGRPRPGRRPVARGSRPPPGGARMAAAPARPARGGAPEKSRGDPSRLL